MVNCSECRKSFDVSLDFLDTDVRVVHCRVCPANRIYAICENCADLNQIEKNPCPWCGATHMWQNDRMQSES